MSEPGYARGYAAGRKRAALDNQSAHASVDREEFRRAVFLAVLPELVRAPWQTGDKTWKTMEQFIDGAAKFAALSVDKFTYPQRPVPLDKDPSQ